MKEKGFQLNDKSFAFLEELGANMPGGLFVYQAEEPGRLIYVNKACMRIFGCDNLEDFKRLTGNTFEGMIYPEDRVSVLGSIKNQIAGSEDKIDYVEYRIIRQDGEVRWVDDYGHFSVTEDYGGVYYVFISDITEKKMQPDEDLNLRKAVIQTLTNSYNTVWLINDVETESCSLYHSDMDAAHSEAIRNALSHSRYTETKTQYVDTMVAEQDKERMQEQISLPYILKQFETRDRFSVEFVRALETGPRHYRIDFGKLYMPGGKTGVTMGFIDIEEEVRQRQELDNMITAMASDYRNVYHVVLDTDDAVCYRADSSDPEQIPEGQHFSFLEKFTEYGRRHVTDEYLDGFLAFIQPDHIRVALSEKKYHCLPVSRKKG